MNKIIIFPLTLDSETLQLHSLDIQLSLDKQLLLDLLYGELRYFVRRGQFVWQLPGVVGAHRTCWALAACGKENKSIYIKLRTDFTIIPYQRITTVSLGNPGIYVCSNLHFYNPMD